MVSSRRPTSVLCAALLLVGLSGCTGGETAASSPTRTETSSRTRDIEGEESTPADDRAAAACLRSERRAVAGVEFPLQQAIDDVMRSTSGASGDAADRVRARAAWVEGTALEQCDRPTPPARDFVRVARQRTRTALGSDDLDVVLRSYAAWATSVGSGDLARALSLSLDECRAVQDRVDASYRTWWRWSDTGRVWWVELTFRNGLGRGLFATLSGRARVTSPESGPRALEWGASSGDSAAVPPGTSRHLVRLGSNGPYVTTGPSDGLRVEDVVVSADLPDRGSWWCSLPVPEHS